MPRKPIDLGGGVNIIVCSRGRRAAPCSVAGCGRPHVALCDYPLTGSKVGRTCDRKLCAQHRRVQGPEVDYCEAHHMMAAQARLEKGLVR